ncbi:TPA: autotransporter domain-containing protein [Escherichia coli]|nr:autotransporter domain-containing protein [Escherichia coli]
MQRKKMLSVCVAMALSSQTWAADTSIAETSDESRKSSKISCPANIKSLSKEQLEKLPAECKSAEDSELLPWAAVGLAAVATGVAVYALHDDNNHHHDDPSPEPDDGGDTPVPPDDGGDTPVPPDDGGDTPVPPDDGGDTPVPPDDGGDTPVPSDDGGDTPVPPDDGGDTPVPPDDGGDTPVPPDDGGDTPVPPDDGGDTPVPPDDGGDTPVPPDDGGDTPVPPDDGGDTPVPPDDGGDDTPDDGGDDTPDDGGDDTPVKHDPVVYKNDVTWDQDAKTVEIRDTTFTYAKNEDGSYTLTGPNGKTTIVKTWSVDEAANTVSFDGVNTAGGITWNYDDDGKIHIVKEAGMVADGTTGDHFQVNDATITDKGGNTALNGGMVMIVDGHDITLNNDGKTTAIGEGSVVGILTGDDITINNNGETEVDGGTAVIINGDRATLNTVGDSTFTNGGTGSLINGDNARVDNKGSMTVDGENSTGSKINGNHATVKQDGDLYVSGAAHGIEIHGTDAIVNNKGNITVVNEKSVGVLLDGEKTTFLNMGDITVGQANDDGQPVGILVNGDNTTFVNVGDITTNNSGTGISVMGDEGSISLAGSIQIDGASTGLDVSGDKNTVILSTYELNVIGDAATGLNIAGAHNSVEISGNMNVAGEHSVGTKITGDNASVNQKGDLHVSGGAYGIEIAGDASDIINDGDIYTTDAGSVGVQISSDNSRFNNRGTVEVSTSSTGIDIIGLDPSVMLDGSINVTAESDDGAEEELRFDNNNGLIGVHVSSVNTAETQGEIFIDGDLNVTSLRDNPMSWINDTSSLPSYGRDLAGVKIDGEYNYVQIAGSINIIATPYHVDLASGISSKREAYQDNINGLIITGKNNAVVVDGGINIDASQTTTDWTAAPEVSGLAVSGEDNIVTVNGSSTVKANSALNTNMSFAKISDGSSMILAEGSTLDMDLRLSSNANPFLSGSVIEIGSNADLINRGDITGYYEAVDSESVIDIYENSLFLNDTTGLISMTLGKGLDDIPSIINVSDSSVINKGEISINSSDLASMESIDLNYNGGIVTIDTPEQYSAISANKGESVIKNEGTITSMGGNSWGIITNETSLATNSGVMVHEGVWYDSTGASLNCDSDIARCFVALGGDVSALDDSSITNVADGKINVVNAGIGMLSVGSGSTVINQGEINLTSDERLGDDTPYLIGMAVLSGGTAVNDTTGVININANNGQAFYNDGTGFIINYGTICTFGNCLEGNSYNDTDDFTSLVYTGGDKLSDSGENKTLAKTAVIVNSETGNVINQGIVSGDSVIVKNGVLENTSSGIINNYVSVSNAGELDNYGSMTNNVDINGGFLNNEGIITGTVIIYADTLSSKVNNAGTINQLVQKSGTFNNSGFVNERVIQSGGTFNNQPDGEVNKGAALSGTAVANNDGTWRLGSSSGGNNSGMLEVNNNAVFTNRGEFILDNNKNAVHINQFGTLYNTGHMDISNSSHNSAVNMWGGNGRFINDGTVDVSAKSLVLSTNNAGDQNAFFWNQDNGVINFDHDSASVVKFTHSNFIAQNDGTMNISGTNAVAMEGDKNAQLVNNGTINLGTEGTTDTGMIGMQLDANATADAVIENNGTINIFANDSFAFSVLGTEGHVVNNGTVVIADGVTGSGLIKQGDSVNVEGVNGNNGNNTKVHYGDYTLPDVPNTNTVSVTPGSDATDGGMNNLNGYVVGTSADGSAGKLKVNNASMNGVGINTGFTSGTADTTVSFDNVVEGSNLTDADAITSTSVVWTAKGSTDANGNVDVTMSKNAYTDVATDASVNDIAKALDAGYTNNELFTSLNVGTTAELNSALKQVSGSQATTVFREARVLSNRFSMLADAAPKVGNGLAFNVVAKGDPRAELGNNTEYDMLALRKTVDLSESQTMSLEYGIARLDGDGAQKAGDNGVTGGYSQFFGLKHQMSFDNGMNWNNALRYDVHNLDSSRSIAFSNTNKTADTDVKQQYLEFRSEGAKTFEPSEGLKVTPYAGVKLRHTLEGGYQERNAGDFNLSMNSGSETAVDSIVGLKLDYAGKDGWSANATLEGGPNLSYSKSQRTASLAGAGSQHFNVDDGQKGGGINSLASVGVKYSSKESSLNLDAYHWKEDGISDKGVMLNFKKTF